MPRSEADDNPYNPSSRIMREAARQARDAFLLELRQQERIRINRFGRKVIVRGDGSMLLGDGTVREKGEDVFRGADKIAAEQVDLDWSESVNCSSAAHAASVMAGTHRGRITGEASLPAADYGEEPSRTEDPVKRIRAERTFERFLAAAEVMQEMKAH